MARRIKKDLSWVLVAKYQQIVDVIQRLGSECPLALGSIISN
jgi:hypothetical protein